MKISILLAVMLGMAVPALAYQAGPANPTKFGSAQQDAGQNNYRSFSNYNDRVRTQGVQTESVQTQVAGSNVKDLSAQKQGKKAVAVAAQKPSQQPQAQQQATATATQPSTAPVAGAAGTDPAAIMQQVQGMVNSMGSLSGALQQGTNGQAAAGMPDISALMNGAIPAGTSTPAKK